MKRDGQPVEWAETPPVALSEEPKEKKPKKKAAKK